MTTYKLISADSHIVEPPDLYTNRIEPRFRDRAPRMERVETPRGRKYDAWFIDGQQVGTLGAVMQAGQRFEDPSQIDFLGLWEDVRLGAYDPQATAKFWKEQPAERYAILIKRLEAQEAMDPPALEALYRFLAADLGLKLVDLAQLTRIALTGKTASPPIFEVVSILGKAETIARLKTAAGAVGAGR